MRLAAFVPLLQVAAWAAPMDCNKFDATVGIEAEQGPGQPKTLFWLPLTWDCTEKRFRVQKSPGTIILFEVLHLN